jgi:hypothetical protein
MWWMTVCRWYLYQFVKSIPLPIVVLCSRRAKSNCAVTHPTLTCRHFVFPGVPVVYFTFFLACSSLRNLGVHMMYVCWIAVMNWCCDSMPCRVRIWVTHHIESWWWRLRRSLKLRLLVQHRHGWSPEEIYAHLFAVKASNLTEETPFPFSVFAYRVADGFCIFWFVLILKSF